MGRFGILSAGTFSFRGEYTSAIRALTRSLNIVVMLFSCLDPRREQRWLLQGRRVFLIKRLA